MSKMFPLSSAISTAAVLLTVSTIGCGNNTSVNPGPDAPDTEYLKHEGGEVRLEYVGTSMGTTVVIAYAFFLGSQAPEKIPYSAEGCSNLTGYLNVTNAAAVNNTRTFLDVGDTVTLSGPGTDIVMPRYSNIPDKRGLVMGTEYAKNGMVRGQVVGTDLTLGASYQISTSGMGKLSMPLKLPTAWKTTGGNMNFGVNAVNMIPPNTDLSWQYANLDASTIVDNGTLLFTGMNSQGVTETWFCQQGPTGHVDIPAAQIAMFPQTGQVQSATITHEQVDFNGRVVDLYGVNCLTAPYTRM